MFIWLIFAIWLFPMLEAPTWVIVLSWVGFALSIVHTCFEVWIKIAENG